MRDKAELQVTAKEAIMMTAANYYRNLGLAGGSLWLVAAGGVFAAWSLIEVQSALAMTALLLLSVGAGTLMVFGVQLVRRVRRLARGAVDDRSRGRRIARQFGMIVAAEGFGCAGVALMCSSMHQWKLIVPLSLVVVGLHFLPLARLFEVPRYILTGALFCIIPIATILLIPASGHIGHAISWIAIPALGCAVVAMATAWAGLLEVRRFLGMSGQQPPVLVSAAHSV